MKHLLLISCLSSSGADKAASVDFKFLSGQTTTASDIGAADSLTWTLFTQCVLQNTADAELS